MIFQDCQKNFYFYTNRHFRNGLMHIFRLFHKILTKSIFVFIYIHFFGSLRGLFWGERKLLSSYLYSFFEIFDHPFRQFGTNYVYDESSK